MAYVWTFSIFHSMACHTCVRRVGGCDIFGCNKRASVPYLAEWHLPNGSCRMATPCLCQLLITLHGCQMACHAQVLSRALATVARNNGLARPSSKPTKIKNVLSCAQLNFSGGFVSMPQPSLCKNIGVGQWQWLSQIAIYRDHWDQIDWQFESVSNVAFCLWRLHDVHGILWHLMAFPGQPWCP